ncbi:MAG: YciI family protein [Candidatus Sumerlaeia bacterium]|nr:YciI family protein [Candidatus Sumerlaeia bacterium]
MKVTFLIRETSEGFASRTDPERAPAYWAAYAAYFDALREAGFQIQGGALQPPHAATTVRVRDGKRVVQDGPHATSKEELGGYFTTEMPDLETALRWAERCPAAEYGCVEVVPNLEMAPRG